MVRQVPAAVLCNSECLPRGGGKVRCSPLHLCNSSALHIPAPPLPLSPFRPCPGTGVAHGHGRAVLSCCCLYPTRQTLIQSSHTCLLRVSCSTQNVSHCPAPPSVSPAPPSFILL
ncbi:hypothetical protein Pmani_028666 [Petrolisthes manimaculis]|uniref:Uncharacterized protein n=1 Tax=Petrolisthes manimaculis TaxID=1843537 RepID=A0AAE1TXU0_9EUCA|nr:hypothetical protein Pmani_028666 [Petrolisthes manimaculis]